MEADYELRSIKSIRSRLSRLDLAFDIFNRPEIVFYNISKEGLVIKYSTVEGNIESKYWGASGSNVQVRCTIRI